VARVKLLPIRRGPSKFQRAADGSMSLIEHLMELRSRLFKASLAIVAGGIIGYLVSNQVLDLLKRPYCLVKDLPQDECQLQILDPLVPLTQQIKISLLVALILAGPVWLYQLWAFIAPGLHRHERRWAYWFVAIAAPLFAAGVVLAYFVVEKGLGFLLEDTLDAVSIDLELARYISFITTVMLVFGVSFEFPLVFLMLNFAGLVSARRMLSWWRVAILAFTVFAAVTVPDPGPFGMLLLAACLTVLYFAAVGVAFLNDRRRARRDNRYADVGDDEISPLEDLEPVTAGDPVFDPEPVLDAEPLEELAPVARPAPLEPRYDDVT
jgi:sec-independent protein translocase protein TatC